jgi:hypothetical protein
MRAGPILLLLVASSCALAHSASTGKIHKLVHENDGFSGCSARTEENWCTRTMRRATYPSTEIMAMKVFSLHNASDSFCLRSDGVWCGWTCDSSGCACHEDQLAKPLEVIANKAPYLVHNSSDTSTGSPSGRSLNTLGSNKAALSPLKLLPKLLKNKKEPGEVGNATKETELERTKEVAKETCFTVETSLTKTLELVVETVLNEILSLNMDFKPGPKKDKDS